MSASPRKNRRKTPNEFPTPTDLPASLSSEAGYVNGHESPLMPTPDDRVCANASDQRAWQDLFNRYSGPVFRFAARHVDPDVADDIVQVTFAGFARFLPRYERSKARVSTVLFTIAGRAIADQLRRELRHASRQDHDSLEALSDFRERPDRERGQALEVLKAIIREQGLEAAISRPKYDKPGVKRNTLDQQSSREHRWAVARLSDIFDHADTCTRRAWCCGQCEKYGLDTERRSTLATLMPLPEVSACVSDALRELARRGGH